ncbi:hypothetical protein BDV98DRAFT_400366 [Pterulicium gracile]|uniref:Uncharacterized protein n=1 Tax=Pterulicium gracile TaxID=1884261 RepID=A0A5C3Q4Z4_9AGAR|nr:hypothetical protein BDV98DRAFT_400366 [Pterula gracilis]
MRGLCLFAEEGTYSTMSYRGKTAHPFAASHLLGKCSDDPSHRMTSVLLQSHARFYGIRFYKLHSGSHFECLNFKIGLHRFLCSDCNATEGTKVDDSVTGALGLRAGLSRSRRPRVRAQAKGHWPFSKYTPSAHLTPSGSPEKISRNHAFPLTEHRSFLG